MNGIRIVHRLYPATNVGLVARIPEFVVDDALADPPVEVAQIECCGAFVCRITRHWKIVRFWNSDSVGWKLWPQTALSNSAAAKGVPPAATEHARLSQLARVERSEEHTSELQSLMRISYAVFCLKKKKDTPH